MEIILNQTATCALRVWCKACIIALVEPCTGPRAGELTVTASRGDFWRTGRRDESSPPPLQSLWDIPHHPRSLESLPKTSLCGRTIAKQSEGPRTSFSLGCLESPSYVSPKLNKCLWKHFSRKGNKRTMREVVWPPLFSSEIHWGGIFYERNYFSFRGVV